MIGVHQQRWNILLYLVTTLFSGLAIGKVASSRSEGDLLQTIPIGGYNE